MKKSSRKLSFSEMPTDNLGTYLMDVHHPYLQKTLSTFLICAKTISTLNADDKDFPAFNELLDHLGRLIEMHFTKDEEILFPFLRLKIEKADHTQPKDYPISLKQIKTEHSDIIRLFKTLRAMSNNYTPAAETPASVKLCYAQLFNFEQDILKHVFLEEEILFPRLILMDKQKNQDQRLI